MGERYEFTPEQETAIGHHVADHLGANMQTGINENGLPYIASQMSPAEQVRFAEFHRDGTVVYS